MYASETGKRLCVRQFTTDGNQVKHHLLQAESLIGMDHHQSAKSTSSATSAPEQNIQQHSQTTSDVYSQDVIFRKVRGILNKITPETFDKLSRELINVGLNSPRNLRGVIYLLFDKALKDLKYSSLYAKLCQELSERAPNFEQEHGPNTFCKFLISKCEDEFERRRKATEDFDGKNELTDEEFEQKAIAKQKMLGNIKFICELGKKRLLQEEILHECIRGLLSKKKDRPIQDQAQDLECLCQIMRTIGSLLDVQASKNLMNQYFERIDMYSRKPDLPSRIRFMLRDVIDLRNNNWRPRPFQREDNVPQPLSKLREEAGFDSASGGLIEKLGNNNRNLIGIKDISKLHSSKLSALLADDEPSFTTTTDFQWGPTFLPHHDDPTFDLFASITNAPKSSKNSPKLANSDGTAHGSTNSPSNFSLKTRPHAIGSSSSSKSTHPVHNFSLPPFSQDDHHQQQLVRNRNAPMNSHHQRIDLFPTDTVSNGRLDSGNPKAYSSAKMHNDPTNRRDLDNKTSHEARYYPPSNPRRFVNDNPYVERRNQSPPLNHGIRRDRDAAFVPNARNQRPFREELTPPHITRRAGGDVPFYRNQQNPRVEPASPNIRHPCHDNPNFDFFPSNIDSARLPKNQIPIAIPDGPVIHSPTNSTADFPHKARPPQLNRRQMPLRIAKPQINNRNYTFEANNSQRDSQRAPLTNWRKDNSVFTRDMSSSAPPRPEQNPHLEEPFELPPSVSNVPKPAKLQPQTISPDGPTTHISTSSIPNLPPKTRPQINRRNVPMRISKPQPNNRSYSFETNNAQRDSYRAPSTNWRKDNPMATRDSIQTRPDQLPTNVYTSSAINSAPLLPKAPLIGGDSNLSLRPSYNLLGRSVSNSTTSGGNPAHEKLSRNEISSNNNEVSMKASEVPSDKFIPGPNAKSDSRVNSADGCPANNEDSKENQNPSGLVTEKDSAKDVHISKFMSLLQTDSEKQGGPSKLAFKVRELKIPKVYHNECLVRAIKQSISSSEESRIFISTLLTHLVPTIFDSASLLKAFKVMFDQLQGLEVETPKVRSLVAGLIGQAVVDGLMTLEDIGNLLLAGKHHPLFLLILQKLEKKGGQAWLCEKFAASKIILIDMLPEVDRTKERLANTLKDRCLGFLDPMLTIEPDLLIQMKERDSSPATIYRWIKENVDPSLQAIPMFAHVLIMCLLKYIHGTVSEKFKNTDYQKPAKESNSDTDESQSSKSSPLAATSNMSNELEKEILTKYQQVLQAILKDKEMQLASLYALQIFYHGLDFPKGALLRWFHMLYDLNIVDDDVFFIWKEEINDEHPGKGQALFQVNTWLNWLAESESEEEEDE